VATGEAKVRSRLFPHSPLPRREVRNGNDLFWHPPGLGITKNSFFGSPGPDFQKTDVFFSFRGPGGRNNRKSDRISCFREVWRSENRVFQWSEGQKTDDSGGHQVSDFVYFRVSEMTRFRPRVHSCQTGGFLGGQNVLAARATGSQTERPRKKKIYFSGAFFRVPKDVSSATGRPARLSQRSSRNARSSCRSADPQIGTLIARIISIMMWLVASG